MKKSIINGILIFALGISLAQAEDHSEYVRSHYTKFEYRIPMRDGVKLFTAVYSPNDSSKNYPILLYRTPYSISPYGVDQYKRRLGPHPEFDKEGFIFVFQDVRGKRMSEGEFVNMRPHVENKTKATDIDESTDTYDTIEWLLKNVSNHNGRVGQLGVSYPGFYTSAGAIDSHPALKAISPQAPIADWFWDDFHRHGAFALSMGFNFFGTFGIKRDKPSEEGAESLYSGKNPYFTWDTPDGYQFFLDLGPLKNVNREYFKRDIDFWNKMMEHPNYDEFWQSRNILPHLENIKAAVMTVGGWFDTEDLYGPLNTYKSIEEQNPGIFNILVMGPWSHGGWGGSGRELGDADFGFRTGDYYKEHVDLKFFKHFLKGEENELDLPEALIFETGANRWRNFNQWPPENRDLHKLYLREQSRLSFKAFQDDKDAFDSYSSDPNKPVPYSMVIGNRWMTGYMAEDQRFAAWRPDVLVYKTNELEDDITLAGPIQANLFVSTTGTDSDWIVKLIDVYPGDHPDRGGQQTLVRAEVFRGRFRESYEHPKPFVSGEITEISYRLNDVLHTFKRGHRIMIQIQSTWFPWIDRNPQKFVPNIYEADEEDFITVTNRVYRTKEHPSHIEVGVLHGVSGNQESYP